MRKKYILSKRILTVIPARGGSVEIPLKNLVPLAGKPLLEYTLRAAQQSRYYEEMCCVVSSDSADIRQTARQLAPDMQQLIRPPELATAQAPLDPVVCHALDWFCAHDGCPELVVVLQPTSPLREAKDIDNCIDAIRAGASAALTGYYLRQFVWLPAFGQVGIESSARLPNYAPDARPNRQSRTNGIVPFVENGAVYATAEYVWDRYHTRIPPNTGTGIAYIEMSARASLEIDSQEDVAAAALYLASRHPAKNKSQKK